MPKSAALEKANESIGIELAEWSLYFEFKKELQIKCSEDWLSIRHKAYGVIQDYMLDWSTKLTSQPSSLVRDNLQAKIEDIKQSLSIYKYLVGDEFERDHWTDLFSLLGIADVTKNTLKLYHFVERTDILLHKFAEIKDLYVRAQGEILIRNSISELIAWFETTEFEIGAHTGENKETSAIIKEWVEVLNQIGEKQSLVVTVKSSEYYHRFVEQVDLLENKYGQVENWLENLNFVQRKWIYLEPIFSRGSLASEANRFKRIDVDFRNVMQALEESNRVQTLFEIEGLEETLLVLTDQLERCQKALNDYLEDKRQKFARLYFVGDDDLLEFLAKSNNKRVIKNNLKKLYTGITDLSLQNETIKEIKSSIGETVQLNNSVKIGTELEEWLLQLTDSMKSTLFALAKKGKDSFSCSESSVTQLPTQLLCLLENVTFTAAAIKAIESGRQSDLLRETEQKIEQVARIQANAGKDKLTLFKCRHLILELIHNKEVAAKLAREAVSSVEMWSWQIQLKYFFGEEIKIQLSAAELDYSFEFMGASQKLVHTPLTDKCYLTLTQALHLGFGGNPYGPAGTGKTESVKALGQVLGRQVLVFNCDEGFDFKSMGRIFAGLVKSGAWGCFDEFNRLLEEQLSAISIQIQLIQRALKEKEKQIVLVKTHLTVDFNSGIFVTLNPIAKGYGGRSKLPDNLKILFRPVAMSVPDNEQIARTLLSAEGFRHAEVLAKKVVAIFTLCRQSLSAQIHYDWGLRALKTILSVASQQIQQLISNSQKPNLDDEIDILIKSIRINVISKLTYSDLTKFDMLVKDVFPSISMSDIAYEELQKAIKASCDSLNLLYLESQVKKITQFHEALNQRIGVVLVGPPGCSKSTIIKILREAYKILNYNQVVFTLNPKAIDRKLLLGSMNKDTGEYSYGVLTKCAREVEKQESSTKCWIVNDGGVDPEWVEALNSVLDDNRLLTLQNGERISFGQNVNFIFETDSLKFASPATVSRMSVIYMNEEDLDYSKIIASKISKHINSIDLPSLVVKCGGHRTLCDNFTPSDSKDVFLLRLVQGIYWHLEERQQLQFLSALSKATAVEPTELAKLIFSKADGSKISQVSGETSVLSASEIEGRCPTRTKKFKVLTEIVKSALNEGKPLLLIGEEGSGKSLVLEEAIRSQEGVGIKSLYCTSQTDSETFLEKLYQVCTVGTAAEGRVIRPKDSKKLVFYVKELNLVLPDKYEDVQLVGLLQQIIELNGFYDKELEFVRFSNIQLVCSITPNNRLISSRVTGKMRSVVVESLDKDELKTVFLPYMKGVIAFLNIKASADAMLEKLITSFYQIRQSFQGKKTFYNFTPKILNRIFNNLLRLDSSLSDQFETILGIETHAIFTNILSQEDKEIGQKAISFAKSESILTSLEGLPSSVEGLTKLTTISKEEYKEKLYRHLVVYERENRELHLELTDRTISLVNSVERLFSGHTKNVLVIGESGAEKKKIVKLLVQSQNSETVSLKISRVYGIREFKKDIKELFSKVANDKRKLNLLVEESHLEAKFIVKYVNTLLASGETPGLFSSEELEPFLQAVNKDFRRQNRIKSVYDYFCAFLKSHLSISVVLDSQDSKFDELIRQNPSFLNKTTVLTVNKLNLEDIEQKIDSIVLPKLEEARKKNVFEGEDADIKAKITGILKDTELNLINTSGKKVEFIRNIALLIKKKLESIGTRADHLSTGLTKLSEAEDFIEQVKKETNKVQLEIAAKQKEADEALADITKAMEVESVKKSQLEHGTRELEKEQVTVQENKAKVESELADVLPEVEKASKMVKNLDSTRLASIRAYFKSPAPKLEVYVVLKAVLQMLGHNDLMWGQIKTTFGMDTINSVASLDISRIKRPTFLKVSAIVSENSKYFIPEVINRVNKDLGLLAGYVSASMKYLKAKEDIKPLEDALIEASEKAEETKIKLEKNKEEYAAAQEQIAKMKAVFSDKTRETEALKSSLRETEEKVAKATNLIEKLGGERKRWSNQLQQLAQANKSLVQSSVFAAAAITFLGRQSEEVRNVYLDKWNEGASLVEFLSSESDQLKMKMNGLPADSLSVQNSIFIANSCKTPLLVDPQSTAVKWMENQFKQEGRVSVFVSAADQKLLSQLELGLRFGKAVVITDVEEVSSYLLPVIRRESFGPRNAVRLGDKMVDMNDKFTLCLATRNSDLNLTAKLQTEMNIVNFSLTRGGIEAILLSHIINIEKPELEKKRNELLSQKDKFKVDIANLESQLLEELILLQGNLIENKKLVTFLEQTKSQSVNLEKMLVESEETHKTIETERSIYKALSAVGVDIFTSLAKLERINNLYCFSLDSFCSLFDQILGKSDKEMLERIEIYMKEIKIQSYLYYSRTLLKEDITAFALNLVQSINPVGNKVFDFICDKLTGSSESQVTFISEDLRGVYATLKEHFGTELNQIGLDDNSAERIVKSSAPEEEISKLVQTGGIHPTFAVAISKALCPPRLPKTVAWLARNEIGVSSIFPDFPSFTALIEDLSPKKPALFITTLGSDPSREISAVAAAEVGSANLIELAMGADMGDSITSTLREASSKGKWLLIKNLHLSVKTAALIETEFKNLRNPNSNFKLLLTTEEHSGFPKVLAQICKKYAFETPPGIKKNMLKSLKNWETEFDSSLSGKQKESLVSGALFHAVLEERKTFVPEGFCKEYEFSNADLKVTMEVLLSSVESKYCWENINGLVETSFYGGRIDNQFDLKVLGIISKELFSGNGTVSSLGKRLLPQLNMSSFKHLEESLNQIPDFHSPAVLGLNPTVEDSIIKLKNKETVRKVLEMESASSTAAESTIATQILEMLHSSGILQLDNQFAEDNSNDPIYIFLSTERDFGFKLLDRIRREISVVKENRDKGLVNSRETEALLDSLAKNLTPDSWLALWDTPLSPIAFISSLIQKIDYLVKASPSALLTNSVDLSNFFFPETLINSYRQQVSRKEKIPLDELHLHCSSEGAGLILSGLFLTGSAFKNDVLVAAEGESTRISRLSLTFRREPVREGIEIPLYQDSLREKLICKLTMKCSNKQEAVLRGISLVITNI